MAITIEKKKELVKEITDGVKSSASTVIVGFDKLRIEDITPLRKNLRTQGIKMTVAKKTLMKRAFEEAGVSGEVPSMEGQIALAFGGDPVIPAKTVAEASGKYKDKVYILGGILDGRFLNKEEMVSLSKIPGREVLLSQLLNVMNAPVQGFVGTLNAVVRDFVCTLDQISKAEAK